MTGIAQKTIIFNDKGEILAIRRSGTDPHRPLTWDLPGGELEIGEDPKEGMLREIKEEVAIDVKNLQLFDIDGRFNAKNEYRVGICYKAEAASTDVILSYEHDQFEWITKEEFLKRESSAKLMKYISQL